MNILTMMAWCLLEKRDLRERDLIYSWNTIGAGTLFRSMNMDPGVAAPLQHKGSDSGEGGKSHSNPDHVYINTWQYFLIAWPTWESLTCGKESLTSSASLEGWEGVVCKGQWTGLWKDIYKASEVRRRSKENRRSSRLHKHKIKPLWQL